MNSKQIYARKIILYEKTKDCCNILNGFYSSEKKAIDLEIKELQNNCTHCWEDGRSGKVDNYCEICGKIL